VSSRSGLLASAVVHRSEAVLEALGSSVQAGDTIDFVTDAGDVLNSDDFLWVPVVSLQAEPRVWSASEGFQSTARQNNLDARAQLAQVLLLSNEFVFLD
jgi:hypothetical protein